MRKTRWQLTIRSKLRTNADLPIITRAGAGCNWPDLRRPWVAAEKDISFEADSVTVNDEDGSLFATGNVLMRQAGMTLRANEVRYNKTKGAVASGDVSFTDTDGAVQIRGDDA